MDHIEIVTALITAIADRREADALALVDRHVSWQPLVRPGLTLYQDHSGFRRMINDVHKAYGRFRVNIKSIKALGDTQVVALVQVIKESSDGDIPLRTSSVTYTLKNGRITDMESELAGD